MSRTDRTQTLPWMAEGSTLFLGQVAGLSDRGFAEPSALPGWTRAHVVAHVARNAEALCHLLTWARTGVETPMYASRERRAADIEHGAGQPPEQLRKEVVETARRLDDALATLPDAAWTAEVRSAMGRSLPAAEVPWMRVREVWMHGVDLGTGATLRALPAGVVAELLQDVTGSFAGRDGAPALRLTASDLDGSWTTGSQPAVDITGAAVDLLGWLTGRSAGEGLRGATPLPDLPPWL